MKIGDAEINWVNSFKYLGFTVTAGNVFSVDCQVIKRKFYAACNSILTHSRRNNELVKLQLVKSYCLSLLTYCMGHDGCHTGTYHWVMPTLMVCLTIVSI